jgi:diguanylate cyclase (GGDEF)-like protein/PAS domain S-box-containing protein
MMRYGAKKGEYPGISSEDEVEVFVHRWTSRFQSDEPYFGEGDFRDGRWVLVSHRRTPSGDYATVRADITVQKTREAEQGALLNELVVAQSATVLAHEEAKLTTAMLRAVADAVPAMVSFVDSDERYAYCNRGYRDTLGIEPENLVGKLVREAVPPDTYAASKLHIDAALAGSEQTFLRSLIVKGEERVIEQRFIPKQLADGTITGFYSIGSDVTERRKWEQALTLEASTDVLTGLLNRRALMEILERQSTLWSVRGETDNGAGGAVLFLDVDHFKQINDTLGHDVGDELLKSFAGKIKSVVRATDTVARLGGDEFVVLLTAPDIEDVARRVSQNLLKKVRLPVELSGGPVSVSTSIGVALVVPGGARVDSAQLLKEADLALYAAKQAGRNTFAVRTVGEPRTLSGIDNPDPVAVRGTG